MPMCILFIGYNSFCNFKSFYQTSSAYIFQHFDKILTSEPVDKQVYNS